MRGASPQPGAADVGRLRSRPGIRYDFRYGRPAIDEFPRKIWRKLLAARARQVSPEAFGYGSPAGYRPLREALAGYLGRARGMACDADQIVIVNGSQQAFDLIARVLLDPGDSIVVEEPHYHGATLAFEAVGARRSGPRRPGGPGRGETAAGGHRACGWPT